MFSHSFFKEVSENVCVSLWLRLFPSFLLGDNTRHAYNIKMTIDHSCPMWKLYGSKQLLRVMIYI